VSTAGFEFQRYTRTQPVCLEHGCSSKGGEESAKDGKVAEREKCKGPAGLEREKGRKGPKPGESGGRTSPEEKWDLSGGDKSTARGEGQGCRARGNPEIGAGLRLKNGPAKR